jgi:hypothetical protein
LDDAIVVGQRHLGHRSERKMDMLARPEPLERLREEIHTSVKDLIQTLRGEIRAGDEETRRVLTERLESLFDKKQRLMRLLHEDLVERITMSGEGR